MGLEIVTKTVASSRNVIRLGSTNVSITAMCGYRGSVALSFSPDTFAGMVLSLRGTPKEMRKFAAELISHADAVDKAQGLHVKSSVEEQEDTSLSPGPSSSQIPPAEGQQDGDLHDVEVCGGSLGD